jgi:hypothetical protein
MVIQRIPRPANLCTTATYCIKTAAGDVLSAMARLERHIEAADRIQADTNGTLDSSWNLDPSALQLR